MSAGQNGNFTHNMVFGCTVAIAIAANISRFNICNNDLGASTNRGANDTAISVAAGTSDHYNITSNITFGATTALSDGGTGIHKAVHGNGEEIPSRFSAHKNGTDQTGVADSTFTDVTWGTEAYDQGNHFASNQWTPRAGPVSMKAAALMSGTWAAGNQIAIRIMKNGAAYKQANWYSAAANQGAAFIAADDIANGTDVYKVQVFVNTDAGTATISGSAENTFFMGQSHGP